MPVLNQRVKLCNYNNCWYFGLLSVRAYGAYGSRSDIIDKWVFLLVWLLLALAAEVILLSHIVLALSSTIYRNVSRTDTIIIKWCKISNLKLLIETANSMAIRQSLHGNRTSQHWSRSTSTLLATQRVIMTII